MLNRNHLCSNKTTIVVLSKGYTDELKLSDPDHLCSLAMEVIPGNSCMVFCATKKNCENVALLLAQGLPRYLLAVYLNLLDLICDLSHFSVTKAVYFLLYFFHFLLLEPYSCG